MKTIEQLERDIDLLCNALEAALRWPYEEDIKQHIAKPSSIPPHYDDSYRNDVYDMRAGVRIIEERRKRP